MLLYQFKLAFRELGVKLTYAFVKWGSILDVCNRMAKDHQFAGKGGIILHCDALLLSQ